MACQQKIRPPPVVLKEDVLSIVDTWEACYPAQITRIEESLVMMKKLLVTGLSNICYNRGIFTEAGYRDKAIGELKFKVLYPADPNAGKFIAFLTGAMDAVSKGYLRTLSLGFYLDENEPDSVIEDYTFTVETKLDGSLCLRDEKKEFKMENLKKDTLKMLSNLIEMTSQLPAMPDDVNLNLKITYTDDTPADYEPPGFMASAYHKFYFKDSRAIRISFGKVNTGFNKMDLGMKSIYAVRVGSDEANTVNTDEVNDKGLDTQETPQSAAGGIGVGKKRPPVSNFSKNDTTGEFQQKLLKGDVEVTMGANKKDVKMNPVDTQKTPQSAAGGSGTGKKRPLVLVSNFSKNDATGEFQQNLFKGGVVNLEKNDSFSSAVEEIAEEPKAKRGRPRGAAGKKATQKKRGG